jgi:hypothetical protein
MSEAVPTLEEILRRFDEIIEPIDEMDVHTVLRQLQKPDVDVSPHSKETVAEFAAFMFSADYHWKGEGWNSYYGPMFGWRDEEGKALHTPDVKQFDVATFAYWEKRAREAKHPVLKVRYADLCWDLQKLVTGVSPHINLARIVIDSTIDVASRRLAKQPVNGRKKLERAMAIALSIGDQQRIEAVRDAVVAYEEAVALDTSAGLWGFSFDLILENKKVPKSPALEAKLVGDLEGRLVRLAELKDGKPVDAWGAEYAALRLAAYYRRLNKPDDVRRVLKIYGEAFERLAETGTGMQASAWLRGVHDHYREFGLRDDAESLLVKVREYSKKSRDEMTAFTDKIEVPKEEMDRYLDSIVQGDLSESLHRLAVRFVPNKDQVADQVKKLRESSPLTSLFSMVIVDSDGRPVSHIGGVEHDLDGRVIHQMSQNMQFGQMFLFLAIDRLRERFPPSADDLAHHLRRSPLFPESVMPILYAGLDAYLRNDHLTAAHLFVPQIEAAVRHLLDLCGGNLWKPHRNGGLMMKNLEDVLREAPVAKSLTENVVLYLRVLLTDQRGWNLRNNICHGNCTTESFGRPMTDRLLHALLVLACVQRKANSPEEAR